MSRTKKKPNKLLRRIVRRTLLVLITYVILVILALIMVLNLIFHVPSPTARNQLTMSLIEASATKWVPALFLGEDMVAQICASTNEKLEEEVTDTSAIVIRENMILNQNDEWINYPDGIRIELVKGDTYNAHVMLVRDPSKVYLGISTHEGFSTGIPGKRITAAMEEEGAIAAINGGAFNDDGTSGSYVGTLPGGIVYSEGNCVWTQGEPPNGLTGFAGFTENNVLIVHQDNISKEQAEEFHIRDGCCFGPVLIMNGEVNLEAYGDSTSGLNPRTAIGQRQDGTVVFVCIDGRQASSLGGGYCDLIDIMVEYDVINACNMDGGSSTVMMYRDTYGLYGNAGEMQMISSYSLLQAEPRKMPDFWLVRP